MVHRLEAEFWERIDFVYLDQYDQNNNAIFERYGLRGRPIFVLIEPDGTEVIRWFGARPEGEIRAALNEYLAAN
jgi:hypothetical protein